jgi:hypothetical protein
VRNDAPLHGAITVDAARRLYEAIAEFARSNDRAWANVVEEEAPTAAEA